MFIRTFLLNECRVSYFSHGFNKNCLRKEVFNVAHSVRAQTIMVKKARQQEREKLSHGIHSRGAEIRMLGLHLPSPLCSV